MNRAVAAVLAGTFTLRFSTALTGTTPWGSKTQIRDQAASYPPMLFLLALIVRTLARLLLRTGQDGTKDLEVLRSVSSVGRSSVDDRLGFPHLGQRWSETEGTMGAPAVVMLRIGT